MNKKVSPIEKFQSIFHASNLLYITEPVILDKGGFIGLIGSKKLDGFNILVNNFDTIGDTPQSINYYTTTSNIALTVPKVDTAIVTKMNVEGKCVSVSQLGKTLGLQAKDITNFMQRKGLIIGDEITNLGKSKGLIMKTYTGSSYIDYPNLLEELSELKQNSTGTLSYL